MRTRGPSSVGLRLVVASLLVPAVAAASELDVVATTPDLGAIAEAVGGERVSVGTLQR